MTNHELGLGDCAADSVQLGKARQGKQRECALRWGHGSRQLCA